MRFRQDGSTPNMGARLTQTKVKNKMTDLTLFFFFCIGKGATNEMKILLINLRNYSRGKKGQSLKTVLNGLCRKRTPEKKNALTNYVAVCFLCHMFMFSSFLVTLRPKGKCVKTVILFFADLDGLESESRLWPLRFYRDTW